MKDNIPYKIYLSEAELPKQWYNVRADMKNKPAPLLNPGTLQPMTAEELGHVSACPAGARLLSGEASWHTCENLLQV